MEIKKQNHPKSKANSDELLAQIDQTLLDHGTMSADDRLAMLRAKADVVDTRIAAVVDEQLGRQARNDHPVPGLSAQLAQDLSRQLAEKLVIVQDVDKVFSENTQVGDSPFGPDVPVFANETEVAQKHFHQGK